MIEIYFLDKKLSNNSSNRAYKFYLRSKNINILVWSNILDSSLSPLTNFSFFKENRIPYLKSQKNYYVHLSKTLLDPQTILNNKKVPCIPLLLHQDKFIIDFKEKAKAFS